MKTKLLQISLVLITTVALLFSNAPKAAAADYSNSHLMDDMVFDNVNSMGDINGTDANSAESHIQTFLNSKGPCLQNYHDVDPAWTGTQWTYTGSVTAAHIITKAAREWGLNPQVILSTLQKEESLITGTDCSNVRLTSAVGYGCPDGNARYDYPAINVYQTCVNRQGWAGFTRQILWGSWQLKFGKERSYGNTAWNGDGNITYVGIMTQGDRKRCDTCQINTYDGNATIDGQTIHIDNGATASFYNYTPHLGQALPGIFEGWFGSTLAINGSIQLSKGLQVTSPPNTYLNDSITASYEIQNTADYSIDAGGFGVCARMNGQNYDLGFIDHVTIGAAAKVPISFTRKLDVSGDLSMFICSYNETMGGWVSARYPYDLSGSLPRQASLRVWENPVMTVGIGLSPAVPVMGEPVTATMSVQNFSANPIDIGSMMINVHNSAGSASSFGEDAHVTIPANSTYTYSKSKTFDAAGTYTLDVVNWRGASYDSSYPKSIDGTIVRHKTMTVLDNPLITTGISLSPSSPAAGQTATATMAIRNGGASPINIGSMVIGARDSAGNNVDFGIINDVIIAPNSTYTYSRARIFNAPGAYSLFIAHWQGSWDRVYPKSADSTVVRQLSVTVVDNPLITSGITLSSTSPTAGAPVTASLTIRNASDSAVAIGSIIIAARDPLGNNVDFAEDAKITIPAGSTYTYSKTKTFAISGNYSLFIVNWRGGGYDRTYPKSADSSILRQLTLHVN